MMNFSRIVTNPPYDRNLHLKCVEESIKHLDTNGELVNLSPVRWLQDPLAKYKKNSDYNKFEKSVAQHIKSLDIIGINEASNAFGIDFYLDLGIYVIDENGGLNRSSLVKGQSLVDKIVKSSTRSFADAVEYDKIKGIRVRVDKIRSMPIAGLDITKCRRHIINPKAETYIYDNGYTKSGKHWSDLLQKNGTSKDALFCSVEFNTYEEALNFENFCKTTFMDGLKNIMQKDQNVPLNYLPWLGNVENPRTHKIGYESDWTDEDLCKVFGITDDEWNEIERTMNELSRQ